MADSSFGWIRGLVVRGLLFGGGGSYFTTLVLYFTAYKKALPWERFHETNEFTSSRVHVSLFYKSYCMCRFLKKCTRAFVALHFMYARTAQLKT